jgi:hypothetical protein
MSDETLDELFREAFDNLDIAFEPSSWEKLKGRLGKTEVFDTIEQAEHKQLPNNQF